MFSRSGSQFIVFFVLSLIGGWIVYKDLTPPAQGGFALYDGMIAAMYWFALLLYALLSLTIGLALRKRSWRSLLLAHLFSVSVAIVATLTLVDLGQQFAADEAEREALDQQTKDKLE
jgi:hypothetical protein